MPETEMAARQLTRAARFPVTKFRPPRLPPTLVPRVDLYARLEVAGSARLGLVTGSPGAGKSVLLASWAATRPASTTAWLSCDQADRAVLRFCFALIEAVRTISAGFGVDAAELLTADDEVSPDAVGLLVNDLAELAPGTAVIIDDFHLVVPAVTSVVNDLIERWPPTVQLVVASRADPPLRLHRLRMIGDLVELRDRDLCFTVDDTERLLTNFAVELSPSEVTLLHQRSEGWVMPMQMAALTIQVTHDSDRVLGALDLQTHAMANYFVGEVLEHQPDEIATFMLETSVLQELTPETCAAVTGRVDAARLLRRVEAANLFLIVLDDDRGIYRYHHLIREILRAELRALDPARQAALHGRAADWFESIGEPRQAIRHLLKAGLTDRAFQLLFDSVLPDHFAHPWPEQDFGLDGLNASLIGRAPQHLLALSMELLLRGDLGPGVEYLRLLEQSSAAIPAGSPLAIRLDTLRCLRHALFGQADESIACARSARALQSASASDGTSDSWLEKIGVVLANVHLWLHDFEAVDRELQAARDLPEWPRLGPAIRALALVEAGYIDEGGQLAETVAAEATRLGFDRQPSAVNYWRALARVAIERRDFDQANQYTHAAIRISERRRPSWEFAAHLDRAEILSLGGHVDVAIAEIAAARSILPTGSPVVLARADELEALILLGAGDLPQAAEAADRVPSPAGGLLRAQIALARGDLPAAVEQLGPEPPETAPPADRLRHLVLRAAIAIGQHRREADGLLARIVDLASRYGFINSVVTPNRQVTAHLVERSAWLNRSPHLDRVLAAAVEVRAQQSASPSRRRPLIDPLTEREANVLQLLPTSLSSLQMAATLFVSVNTLKTHLRRIYMKLDVGSRSEAVVRAVELGLL